MSYESAPATILLATRCCICGRPLLDAESVECGIGPTCRKGMESDATPDWAQVAEHLATWVAADQNSDQRRQMFEVALEASVDAEKTGDDHKMANVLTHYIAAVQGKESVGHLLMAIRSMGRTRLADALASRLYKIRVRIAGEELMVKFPYSDTMPRRMRAMGARWEKDDKFYRVPLVAARRLWTALKETFPGEKAFGQKGEFTL